MSVARVIFANDMDAKDMDTSGNYFSGTDGSIVWRSIGKLSNFTVPSNAKFCFQHDAHWLSQHDDNEIISLYIARAGSATAIATDPSEVIDAGVKGKELSKMV
ncbi:hypothetical protein C8A01DRAFT_36279 [Parachaetomium inaequale]|uniref:Uncharacterized protein n=1 Tax=Parachaetomium inaequale TaxID=2588326 RepID=A0AAN6SRV3_9PEZI|nr:hypothetical protein C8A01DRAFT_36279 [Parachaetomium inaequale]